MVKRKKRLEKGIASIEEQINIHENKLEKAKQDKNEILEKYYEKEIKALKSTRNRKKLQLEKE